MSEYHIPVLVKEVLEGLRVAPGKLYIDATLGGGGHTAEIVRAGGRILSIDTDKEAIYTARERLLKEFPQKKEGIDWNIVQGNFRDIEKLAHEEGFNAVDGVMFDLGVSSHQLDTASRGFSYRFEDAPLDLRLNQDIGEGAAEYLERVSEQALYETLATFGEEERARAISIAIVRARVKTGIATTRDLLTCIKEVVGGEQVQATASRVFQALRIAVNDELGALKSGLKGAEELLIPKGRLVVISFHSLEDRIVKQYLRTDRWKVITKKPVVAGKSEIGINKRSRSAKLRIAEKI